jgi:flotillin
MIVLNGAQGLSDALAQALSQGVAGLQLARNLLAGPGIHGNGDGRNGRVPAPEPTPEVASTTGGTS